MNSVKYGFSHPVLFIFDMECEEVVVPDIGDDFQVSGTSSCVAVRVIPDTDGEVEVSLESLLPEPIKKGKIRKDKDLHRQHRLTKWYGLHIQYGVR